MPSECQPITEKLGDLQHYIAESTLGIADKAAALVHCASIADIVEPRTNKARSAMNLTIKISLF